MDLLRVDLIVNDKIVKESVSRIGICDRKRKILWPSCYIVRREGEYYLAHFKQLFSLKDGGYSNVSEDDIKRRNAIAFCLKNWGLIDVEEEMIQPHDIFVFVLSHRDKDGWKIKHKINTWNVENL